MVLVRTLAVAILLVAISGPRAAADEPVAPPASLMAALLPPSAWLVMTQVPIEGEPALEIIAAPTTQVLVGRITSDGTKVLGCADDEESLRRLLEAPAGDLRKKSRAEVK